MTFPSNGYANIAAAAADGCIHYWPMNETSGGTAVDTVAGGDGQCDMTVTSDIADASIVSGKFVNGRDASGPGTSPHAVFTMARNAGTTATSYSSWTFSMWFKFDTLTPADIPYIFEFIGGSANGIYAAVDGSSNLLVTTSPTPSPASFAGIVASTWYHLVFTCDGVNTSAFLNGVEHTSVTAPALQPYSEDRFFGMYIATDTDIEFVDGPIDDIAIWDRDLSAAEVSTMYNSGSGFPVILVPGIPVEEFVTGDVTISLSSLFSFPKTITDDSTFSDSVESLMYALISEKINLTATQAGQAVFGTAQIDTLTLSDELGVLLTGIIQEIVELSLSEILQHNKLINLEELIEVSEIVATNALLNSAVSVLLNFSDTISPDAFELLAEIVNISLSETIELLHNEVIVDASEYTGVPTEFITFSVLAEDDGSFTDTVDLRSTLSTGINDNFIFTTTYSDSEQVYSSWVMNPETFSISNYDLSFTHTATFNEDTLLANSTGLYVHEGTRDAGAYIESKIKTAALNFGSSSSKQCPEALLGISGDRFILGVSVDERTTAYYELTGARDGLSTKQIKIGKGLIGRYWQFEVRDVSSDEFNLDDFEFFPIQLKRKHS